MEKGISIQTIQRMPLYLSYLRTLPKDSAANISARAIADALGLGEIQVRKDLAAVSGGGKPKVGYEVKGLIADIEDFLGYSDVNDAVLAGAGKLGRALMSYAGFAAYGMNIVAAFDTDADSIGRDEAGKPVYALDRLPDLVRRMNIRIGIITVPAKSAQEVCDLMVQSGIKAIWNFAPAHLRAPEGILIQSENMAASLALLGNHLKKTLREEQGRT